MPHQLSRSTSQPSPSTNRTFVQPRRGSMSGSTSTVRGRPGRRPRLASPASRWRARPWPAGRAPGTGGRPVTVQRVSDLDVGRRPPLGRRARGDHQLGGRRQVHRELAALGPHWTASSMNDWACSAVGVVDSVTVPRSASLPGLVVSRVRSGRAGPRRRASEPTLASPAPLPSCCGLAAIGRRLGWRVDRRDQLDPEVVVDLVLRHVRGNERVLLERHQPRPVRCLGLQEDQRAGHPVTRSRLRGG